MTTRRRFRTVLRASVFCVLATGALFMAAGVAVAQSSERITFDFTAGSSLSLLGGTILTPPDGTLDTGSARVYVEASAPGAYVAGGIVLLDAVTVGGTIAKIIPGFADIAGPYAAVQTGPLAGTLAVGETGADFTDDLSLDVDAVIGCTGTGCGSLGFPASEIGNSLLDVTFLPIDDLGVVGGASIQATIPIEFDGVLGELNLVGVEVSRTFIPEPGTFLLVCTGLGVLAGRRRSGLR